MGSGVLGSATMERRSREAARVSQEAVEALKEDIVGLVTSPYHLYDKPLAFACTVIYKLTTNCMI